MYKIQRHKEMREQHWLVSKVLGCVIILCDPGMSSQDDEIADLFFQIRGKLSVYKDEACLSVFTFCTSLYTAGACLIVPRPHSLRGR